MSEYSYQIDPRPLELGDCGIVDSLHNLNTLRYQIVSFDALANRK